MEKEVEAGMELENGDSWSRSIQWTSDRDATITLLKEFFGLSDLVSDDVLLAKTASLLDGLAGTKNEQAA